MKPDNRNSALIRVVGLLVLALCFYTVFPAGAEDAKTLLNEVSKQLRQAEKDMFAGKTENAIAALDPIKEHLSKVKADEPNNPGLKSMEKKYEKLVKDLERRTGKDLGGGTLTAAGASTETALPSRPEVKAMPEKEAPDPLAVTNDTEAPPEPAGHPETARAPTSEGAAGLPHAARRPLDKARADIGRIDGYIYRLEDPTWNRDQAVGNMDQALRSARKNLDEAKALAAEKGLPSHPDLDQAEADLAEAEEKADQAKQAYEESKTAAAAQAEEVNADVQALLDEYNRVQPVFAKAPGVVIYYNDLKPVKALLADIEDFEGKDLENIRAKMDAFARKYGTTKDEIDKKADAMGYSGQNRASFPYRELAAGIENIQKTREAMAADLIRKATEMRDQTATGVHGFYRLEQYSRLKEWGREASKFDPDNPQVKDYNVGIEGWIEEDMKAFNAQIDKVAWPGHAPDAPDEVKNLASVAMKFLQQEEDKRAAQGKPSSKILAVAVKGPWRVFKTNILGEPIQYNLPILSAVQNEEEKGMNLARVYDSTLLTQEGRGVKMAPPFIGATVGNSYYMRPAAIK